VGATGAGDAARTALTSAAFLLRLGDPWLRDVVRAQDLLVATAQGFFRTRGLTYMNLPITTGAVSSPMGAGSDSMPVAVTIGGVDTYLADSMQFLLEYGCRLVDRGCFYLMPSFRGEPVDETHLQQFFHLEAEVPGSFEDVRRLVEDFLRAFADEILETTDRFSSLTRIDHLTSMTRLKAFPILTYKDAFALLGGVEGCFEIVENVPQKRITRRGV
jgi:asparaginyl-tRNA synthetase